MTGGGRRPVRPLLPYGLTFTGMMVTTLVTPIVPDILDDLGADRSQAGIFVMAGPLPAIIVAPVMGVLADRIGRRAVLLPCLVAVAVLGVAGAFAPNYPVLLALRALQGVAAAGLVNLAVVLIADTWEGRERARVLGRNAAVLTGSTAMLAPLGGVIASLGTWRLTFTIYGAALAMVWAIYRAATETPGGAATRVHPLRGELRATGALLGDRVLVRTLVLGVVTLALVFGWSVTLTPVHAEVVLGLGPVARGLLVGAGAATATVLAVSSRWVVGHLGRHRAVLLGFGGFGLGYLLVALVPSSTVALIVALCLAGSAQGTLVPVLQSDMATVAPATQRGAAMSLWGSAVRTGQTLGPLAVGGLLSLGTAPVYAAGATLAAVAVLGAIRRPAPHRSHSAGADRPA